MDFKKLVLDELNIELNETQIKQFDQYYNLLIEWNNKINLTGITKREDVDLKHFFDSLTLIKSIDLKNQKLCDVGAGAGFPSIPLKIVFPELDVTIVDSLNKRIKFLDILIEDLGLTGIKAVHARAEEFTKKHREKFDIVTARAVARLNILTELCSGLVKVGGLFVAMKSSSAKDEISECINCFDVLGFELEKVVEFKLPIENSDRFIINLVKILSTKHKYPRIFGKIKSKPL